MEDLVPGNKQIMFKSKLKNISTMSKRIIGFRRNGMNITVFFGTAINMFIFVVLSGVKAVQLIISRGQAIMSYLSAVVAFMCLMQAEIKLIFYFINRCEVHKLDNAICRTLPMDSNDMDRKKEKGIYFAVMILIWSSAFATICAILNSNFTSFHVEETLFLYPICMPEFVERNVFIFYVIYGLQVATCYQVVAINGATLASFAHASNVLCVQNKVLGIAIINLTTDDSKIEVSSTTIAACCKEEKIKEYVEFHVHLINIVSQLETVFGGIIIWEFFGSQCMSCLLTYQCIKEAKQGNIIRAIHSICMIPAVLMTSFIYFFLGSKISEASVELRTLVYSSYWYDQPLWFQKFLLIIMKRMQKVLTFNSFHIIPVTLNSFLRALQAGFSYFNFLNAMTGR